MQIRIYYEDTDCGNVVYYANYLKYMERSRTEYIRERGINLAEYQNSGIMFAVVEANIKYRASARYNDIIDVDSSIKEISSAFIEFTTEISRDGQLLVKGDVKLACVNANGRASRIPEEVKNALRS